MSKSADAKPRKHKTLAANRRRRRARANPAPASSSAARANPPVADDFTHVLLPGLGAYAATRVIQRLVYQFVQARWPSLGKHASALAGASAFGSVWFFAHKIKALAPYHDGIVAGSFIGAGQGVLTCYMPAKYSWLLSDCSPDDVAPAVDPAAAATLPDGTTATDPAATAPAGDEYSYLEDQAAQPQRRRRGRRHRQAQAAPAAAPADTSAGDGVTLDPDIAAELDPSESVDDLYAGSFAPN